MASFGFTCTQPVFLESGVYLTTALTFAERTVTLAVVVCYERTGHQNCAWRHWRPPRLGILLFISGAPCWAACPPRDARPPILALQRKGGNATLIAHHNYTLGECTGHPYAGLYPCGASYSYRYRYPSTPWLSSLVDACE